MLRASSGRYCLTPKGEFYLIGYGNRYESRRKPAGGVHDDIYARAVLLEVDGVEIFLFNADYLEFEEWSCNEIKRMMADTYGLNENCMPFFSAVSNCSIVMGLMLPHTVMRRGFIAGRLQSYCVRFSNFGNTAANPAQPASSFS